MGGGERGDEEREEKRECRVCIVVRDALVSGYRSILCISYFVFELY